MGFIAKFIRDLLRLEADSDMILEGKCPQCGADMDEEDTYDGPDCFLCANCREGDTTDEAL